MAEKLAQYRATHDNPHGSDYTFIPDKDGTNILEQMWNVAKGLRRQRNVDALIAKAVDPRGPDTGPRMSLAHDTNQWFANEGPYSPQKAGEQVPNRKKKKRRH